MKRLLAVLILIATAACASTPQWRPPGYDRAYAECDYEVSKAVPDTGHNSVMAMVFERRRLRDKCLTLRGFMP